MALALKTFLRSKVATDKSYTHQSMGGDMMRAVYSLGGSINEFWPLYMGALNSNAKISLAEAPGPEAPVLVDIDIIVPKDKVNIDYYNTNKRVYTYLDVEEIVTCYQNVLKEIVQDLPDEALTCLILEKPSIEKLVDGKEHVKNGLHMHFPKLFLNRKEQATFLIPRVSELLRDVFEKLCCHGKPIDNNITTVPWLMYGSRKPDGVPYTVTRCYAADCTNVGLEDALADYVLDPLGNDESVYVGSNVYDLLPRVLSTILGDRECYYYKTKELLEPPMYAEYTRKRMERRPYAQKTVTENLEEAKTYLAMMSDVRAHERQSWIDIGMAIYAISEGDDEGFDLFNDFSSSSPKYSEADCIYTWNSFKPGNYTMATLVHFARQDSPEAYAAQKASRKKTIYEASIAKNADVDLANLVYNEYKNEFVCIKGKATTEWFTFTTGNHVWSQDSSGAIIRNKISGEIRARYEEILTAKIEEFKQTEDRQVGAQIEGQIKSLKGIVARCGNTASIKSIYTAVVDKFVCCVNKDKFEENRNMDKQLIAFQNGVYDFRHFVFRPGKPEDYLTKKLPIEYNEYSPIHPDVCRLMEFFDKVFPDPELQKYFLDQMCQVFVGGNPEKVVYFWTGVGHNGKSITQKLFERMLRPKVFASKLNGGTVSADTKTGDGPDPELSRTKDGVRWVVVDEPDSIRSLSSGLLKKLTGGDTLFARDLYQSGENVIEFTPLFKLAIICNKLPPIQGADTATNNRIRVIPFESVFLPASQCPEDVDEQIAKKTFPVDVHFDAKIDSLLEPLAWFFINRYKNLPVERSTPEKVLAATAKYNRSNMVMLNFHKNETMESPGDKIKAPELWEAFKEWYKSSFLGYCTITKADLVDYFDEAWGARDERGNWKGYSLMDLGESDEEDE